MAFTYSVVNFFSFGVRSHQQAITTFSTLKVSSFWHLFWETDFRIVIVL